MYHQGTSKAHPKLLQNLAAGKALNVLLWSSGDRQGRSGIITKSWTRPGSCIGADEEMEEEVLLLKNYTICSAPRHQGLAAKLVFQTRTNGDSDTMP